jgi:hypothetical protein
MLMAGRLTRLKLSRPGFDPPLKRLGQNLHGSRRLQLHLRGC